MRVTLNLCITRVNHHETNIRLFTLPITVDASVTLLEHHQRPWSVEMDESVAQIVQVQTFRGHVGGHENAYRRGLRTEILDDFLLFHIAHASIHGDDSLLR